MYPLPGFVFVQKGPGLTGLIITFFLSQGQTLKRVGVWLRGPVFGHGQLYVACSRVSLPRNLKFAVKRELGQEKQTVQNIVFHEVLLPE